MSIITDSFISPKRSEQIVSVGGLTADIGGFSSEAIQLAIDALKVRGGGTVKLNEGIFEIISPVSLCSNITLTGMGEKTILHKVDGIKSSFVTDADYGELKVTVKDATGFRAGMGIQVYDSESKGWAVSTPVITSIEGNTIFFDSYLLNDYEADKQGVVSNACSIIEGICVQNVKVTDLVVEGGKVTNELMDGCRGGAVYFHKSKNCTAENIKVSDFNGDGISWQITEDITIRNCEVYGCTNFGLHPGTGSLRSVVEGCDVHHNGSDGIFVCWRVQHGSFKNNRIYNNGSSGINIGHKDTDNCFESNHIYNNAFCGIYMRPETESNGAHRNIYKKNIIENNGNTEIGYGILIDSFAGKITIEDNIIRDTGEKVQRTGITINHEILDSNIRNNLLSGHSDGDQSGKG